MSEQLHKELKDAKDNTKGLLAQLEATKQMLNENLATCLQLRTNMHILSGQLQEAFVELSDLKRIKLENEKQIVELAQKINELTAKQECPVTQDDCVAG